MAKKKNSKNKKETREERSKKERQKIENEKRNALSNLFIRIALIILLSICCLLIYCRYTATSGLIINEYKIKSEKIPTSFNGFKIVQFSDIRYGSTINKKELNYIVKKINEQNPDLVLFTGDVIDENYKATNKDIEDITSTLNKINSYTGKYAIMGDLDNEETNIIYSNSNFITLKNTYDTIYYKSYTPIILNGLSSKNKNEINLETGFKYLEDETKKDLFQISLVHESDAYLDIINNYSPDIIMTGNSLGGLIRFPGIDGLIKQKGSKKEIKKVIHEENTTIYNSFGLGTTNIKFRFFNKPSINLYRLYQK